MRYYIYAIQNILNGKIYVGQTKNPNRRWDQHQYDCFTKKETWTRLYYAMRKYGVNNFIYTIIGDYDLSEIDEAEKKWIITLNSRDRTFGYNHEAGGNTNKVVSAETRKKIGDALRGRHHTAETKAHMSASKMGIKPTAEARAKMSASRTGKKLSRTHKDAIANGHMGISIPHTNEAKAIMSEQRRGEKNIRAKLKNTDIPIIFEMKKSGMRNADIARHFNVSDATIWKILTGRAWKNLTTTVQNSSSQTD